MVFEALDKHGLIGYNTRIAKFYLITISQASNEIMTKQRVWVANGKSPPPPPFPENVRKDTEKNGVLKSLLCS